ncbi:DUF4357 domain-containing protein [Trueperella pyogenes]
MAEPRKVCKQDLRQHPHVRRPPRLPSGAASFVYGASANGLTEWRTDDGVTLAQLERGHTQNLQLRKQ